jgi:hypothetical protein
MVDSDIDQQIAGLAKIMGFRTLVVRNSDRLDFREVGVVAARTALLAAYKAGAASQSAVPTPTYWVLHISHRHGDGYWTYDSEDKAKERVLGWAKEWWGQDCPGHDKPDNDADLIEEYYRRTEEQWSVSDTTLNQD